MKKTEEALREARDQMEIRVTERTTELQNSNAELRRFIQEHDRAQQALMKTQAELAHLSRVLSIGESLRRSPMKSVNRSRRWLRTGMHASNGSRRILRT